MPHVHIIGTHQCVKERGETFKRRSKQHYFLCWHDYAEWIVSSFAHKIKYEYYGGNWHIIIEGIALEHFSASNHASSSLTYETVSRQAVFHQFLPYMTGKNIMQQQKHTVNILWNCYRT